MYPIKFAKYFKQNYHFTSQNQKNRVGIKLISFEIGTLAIIQIEKPPKIFQL